MKEKPVEAFLRQLDEDEGFRNRVADELDAAGGDVVRAAAALGYEITVEELTEASRRRGALSEEQLDQISGGQIEGSPIGTAGATVSPSTHYEIDTGGGMARLVFKRR